jgi:predicted ATPase/DNA-binding winged helix-turn-helix (wHTH) protein
MRGADAPAAFCHDFRVGRWLVEPDLGRMRCGKAEVYLRPQLMQVLLLLTEHRGRLVSASLLIERVWGRRRVSSSVVARCISDLRRALGDQARSPTYIETLPKRGYRMAARVQPPHSTARAASAMVADDATDHASLERGQLSGWQEVFVGRDRELNTLAGRLERALHGSGSLVLVAGESGSGKTALLREFVRRAAAIHRELLIGSARGNAHGGFGQPLGIFRDLLALLTGDVQSRSAVRDLDSEQADRLWRGSPSIIRCVLEQAPVLIGDLLQAGPLLDRGLAVGLDRQSAERLSRIVHERASRPPLEWARQEQLTAQIAPILKELTARFPLMLVLDDLQWCDSASAAILFQLAREAPARRLLLLGAYRPSEPIESTGRPCPFDELSAELKTQGEVEVVHLDSAAGRGFVDALLDAEPNQFNSSFRARFTQCTGGTPLFSVELLQAMRHTGAITRDNDGTWTAGSQLDWRRIPGRLEPVIARRVDRLPERLRPLLNVAAVEGEQFTAEVIAAVLGWDPVEVLGTLGEIIDRRHHWVVPIHVERLSRCRRSIYRFRHALFQSWLYAQLSPAERGCLHERIGITLEQLYPDRAGSWPLNWPGTSNRLA